MAGLLAPATPGGGVPIPAGPNGPAAGMLVVLVLVLAACAPSIQGRVAVGACSHAVELATRGLARVAPRSAGEPARVEVLELRVLEADASGSSGGLIPRCPSGEHGHGLERLFEAVIRRDPTGAAADPGRLMVTSLMCATPVAPTALTADPELAPPAPVDEEADVDRSGPPDRPDEEPFCEALGDLCGEVPGSTISPLERPVVYKGWLARALGLDRPPRPTITRDPSLTPGPEIKNPKGLRWRFSF
ncbi:MAG: hypothetical protein HY815_20000 [Candidatus Riflebacteria bacterium]|nr:hypothetical protein [Candidatus Riflebacteria bacterium]